MNVTDVIVVLDAGHYINTAGKRTPDGFREAQFNYDVASRMKDLLEYIGIHTVLTSPDINKEVSLQTRVDIANALAKKYQGKKIVFVSLHANAYGTGWNSANGWEVFFYKLSGQGELIAKNIRTQSIPFLGVKDRGIKTADFYVIKYTVMPAVLVEHAFMTNQSDANKLKDPAFRQNCAIANTKGLCSYFGIAYKEKPVQAPTPQSPVKDYEKEVIAMKADGQPIAAYTGYTKCLNLANTDPRFAGKHVVMICTSDKKVWDLGVIQTLPKPTPLPSPTPQVIEKEVVKEVPVEIIKEVVKEFPVEVIKEVEVTKEIPLVSEELTSKQHEEVMTKLSAIQEILLVIKDGVIKLVDTIQRIFK